MIGNSPAFRSLVRLVSRAADCDAPLLILGETGTGKEVVARAVHYTGTRKNFPFIPVNCGAIPDGLFENELFGHKQGAFTDARSNWPGLVSLGEGGTIFFDEIEALPTRGQIVLLRFLQDSRYRPLGGNERLANVRIIAASNQDLQKMVAAGTFRADLYFRLNVLVLNVPPLRDRIGDAAVLAEHFLRECATRYCKPEKQFHRDTLDWFDQYIWPGNVRELENLVHREFLMSESNIIRITLPKLSQTTLRPGATLPHAHEHLVDKLDCTDCYKVARNKILQQFDRTYLIDLLSQTRGNVTRAAAKAGKERRAFGKLLSKYHISPDSFRNTQKNGDAQKPNEVPGQDLS